jgi:hypothetical protein
MGEILSTDRERPEEGQEQNFVARKNVLKYDDVLNKQRTVIYDQAARAEGGGRLRGRSASGSAGDQRTIAQYTGEFSEVGPRALCKAMRDLYATNRPIAGEEAGGRPRPRGARRRVQEDARDTAEKEKGSA